MRKRLAAEENDLAAARDDAKAVRLTLKQLHKELLNLAQAQPDFPSGASTVGGRLGLLPSRIRATRVRKKAEGAVQVRLDAITQSARFAPPWYTEHPKNNVSTHRASVRVDRGGARISQN